MTIKEVCKYLDDVDDVLKRRTTLSAKERDELINEIGYIMLLDIDLEELIGEILKTR